jgi:hypothetical protein
MKEEILRDSTINDQFETLNVVNDIRFGEIEIL